MAALSRSLRCPKHAASRPAPGTEAKSETVALSSALEHAAEPVSPITDPGWDSERTYLALLAALIVARPNGNLPGTDAGLEALARLTGMRL